MSTNRLQKIASLMAVLGILGGLYFVSFREEEQLLFPTNKNIEFITAGVPRPMAEARDYGVIFKELKNAGIDGFFGVFLYQEVPEPKSLGYEGDFLPPCTEDMPSLVALREHRMKLLIPGEILYPSGNIPPINQDPLRELLACVGRDSVIGVMNYDEPAWNGNLLEASRLLYQRVKEVDTSLPVFMVQAPLPAIATENGVTRNVTEFESRYYFNEIKKYNRYADIIGFDVYPIPTDIALLSSPYTQGRIVTDYKILISDYLKWLKENSNGKPIFIALQAFAYSNLGEKSKHSNRPTNAELTDMVALAHDYGVSYIAWFGPSYLTKNDLSFWQDVLTVSRILSASWQNKN